MYSLLKNNRLQFLYWSILITGISIICLILNAWNTPIIVIILSICLLSFLVSFFSSYIKRAKTRGIDLVHELEKNSLQKELERVNREKAIMSKELAFFKNQFNSHVIFNFLNFCYSKVHKSSSSAAEAIEIFADMLRYSLQIKADEPVPLKKEIEYLENFIRIQRCLTLKVCIDFKYEGCISEKAILPHVLVTFLENAFKHGEINNELHPIEIYLFAETDKLIFNVKNKKSTTKRIEGVETNHQDIEEMLNSLYKGRYELKVKNTIWDYSSELVLGV